MPPHPVLPDIGGHRRQIGAVRLQPRLPQRQSGQLGGAFAVERALQIEEEQLPAGFVAQGFRARGRHRKAPPRAAQIDPRRRGRKPVRACRAFGQGDGNPPPVAADRDRPEARALDLRAGAGIGDARSVGQGDPRFGAVLHPAGKLPGGIAALGLAFDGDLKAGLAAIQRDMGLEAPEIAQQHGGVFRPHPRGDPGQIEAEEDRCQIGHKQQRGRQTQRPAPGQAAPDLGLCDQKRGRRHAGFPPLTSFARARSDSVSTSTMVRNSSAKIATT